MNTEEDKRITRTGDIHLRCYQEDKDFLIQRAKDGFGKDENSMTNVMLYALRHVDDTSPITLSHVDGLIRAISENRQTLAEVHADISRISNEINSIGNNINQIAKGVNTALKIAREDNPKAHETINRILSFQDDMHNAVLDFGYTVDNYEKNFSSAKTRINSCLRKEDELLTKTLVHPRVGKAQQLEAQLLRLLEEYMEIDQMRFGRMNVVNLLLELREKVKANYAEEDTENKEGR